MFNYEGAFYTVFTSSSVTSQRQAMSMCKEAGASLGLLRVPPNSDSLHNLNHYITEALPIPEYEQIWVDGRTTEDVGEFIVPGVNGKIMYLQ